VARLESLGLEDVEKTAQRYDYATTMEK